MTLDYQDGSVTTVVLKLGEGGTRQRPSDAMREGLDQPPLAVKMEDEEAKGCGQTPEAGKGKEPDSSLEPLGRSAAPRHHDFSPVRPI